MSIFIHSCFKGIKKLKCSRPARNIQLSREKKTHIVVVSTIIYYLYTIILIYQCNTAIFILFFQLLGSVPCSGCRDESDLMRDPLRKEEIKKDLWQEMGALWACYQFAGPVFLMLLLVDEDY